MEPELLLRSLLLEGQTGIISGFFRTQKTTMNLMSEFLAPKKANEHHESDLINLSTIDGKYLGTYEIDKFLLDTVGFQGYHFILKEHKDLGGINIQVFIGKTVGNVNYGECTIFINGLGEHLFLFYI